MSRESEQTAGAMTVPETVTLLNQLRDDLSEFADREEQLQKEFAGRKTAAETQLEAKRQEEKQRLARAQVELDREFQARESARQAAYQKRQTRISKLQQQSKNLALAKIEQQEGRRKYQLQKDLLETERRRKAERDANEQAHASFKEELAVAREEFVDLEEEALRAFSGYGAFRRLVYEPGETDLPRETPDHHALLGDVRQLRHETEGMLGRFRKLPLPAFFKFVPFWLLVTVLVAVHAAWIPVLQYLGRPAPSWTVMGVSMAVFLVALGAVYWLGKRKGHPSARALAEALEKARVLHNTCLEAATAHYEETMRNIEEEAARRTSELNEAWARNLEEAEQLRATRPQKLEARARNVASRNETLHQTRAQRSEQEKESARERLSRESAARLEELAETHQETLSRLQSEQEAQWQTVIQDWQQRVQPSYQSILAAQSAVRDQAGFWRGDKVASWQPPAEFSGPVRFGQVEVDMTHLSPRRPHDERLAWPGPVAFSLPLVLQFPREASVLFETEKAGSERAGEILNSIILRLLAQAPAGRVHFTIIDPVKLGQNFAGIMHLADYEENVIHSRIWTQPEEIEQRLAELNEHMEKVIQMYLRNEYETIAEYNKQAGNIAEQYYFLVVADFPVNFSESALQRLVNIAASGARCGVYTLIHWDRRQVLPPNVVLDDLRQSSACLNAPRHPFVLSGQPLGGVKVVLDSPPPPDIVNAFLHKVGLNSKDANRIEVPFAQVAPGPDQVWSLTTGEELRVPIGRTGATKLQYLAIGRGTRQHALVAGKTGAGKSNLFHVVITNLALWCSPEQVAFYLVDFKKGVEFKCYASHQLPHARVVAIESDREFGLSVLQRVDQELKERGDLFRQLGVQDLPGFQRARPGEPMPRLLLLVDEFQELFVEDDRVAQEASALLDRIVRQGRAFGIHVLLGSQTLGGAYTLARTTIGQMVVRIALQCNEADAYLIMDDNNPAPRLLSRPGEGIYNDMAGSLEANSPFQAVWLPDHDRDQSLEVIRRKAEASGHSYTGPFVFEGNAPADILENHALRSLLENRPAQPPPSTLLWLGAPNSIKGPTEAVFHRQSGHHLLLVGQREEAVLSLLSLGLLAAAAQWPADGARFVFFDSAPAGSPQQAHLQRVFDAVPHQVVAGKNTNLAEVLGELAGEMKKRTENAPGTECPSIFLFLNGLQQFKKLRQKDEFDFSMDDEAREQSPASILQEIITEGAPLGIHVLASCDTLNNVHRFLGRKVLSEFEMRVLFQMSANDSSSLIDSPKASQLGLHRALFYNEQEGYLETFRPYALPSADWLEYVAGKLQ